MRAAGEKSAKCAPKRRKMQVSNGLVAKGGALFAKVLPGKWPSSEGPRCAHAAARVFSPAARRIRLIVRLAIIIRGGANPNRHSRQHSHSRLIGQSFSRKSAKAIAMPIRHPAPNCGEYHRARQTGRESRVIFFAICSPRQNLAAGKPDSSTIGVSLTITALPAKSADAIPRRLRKALLNDKSSSVFGFPMNANAVWNYNAATLSEKPATHRKNACKQILKMPRLLPPKTRLL